MKTRASTMFPKISPVKTDPSKYTARVKFNQEWIYLGRFDSFEAANKAVGHWAARLQARQAGFTKMTL